ncbi:hypothetical protein Bca52824_023146 [Brassica carinata]|uniref:F-box domain-containing protein n=1 Tax=Brassica carinata TaxID=52824 RepID=A0A8X8AS88_BRACI|nr:hypothetical protein Bca52824_023146 [Brassica carinata]
MEYFPLLELPEDIQALVVQRVARNSILDLFCVRESSKWMKALVDRRREGNPSTIYIKGAQFVYTFGFKKEGLALMKRAADAGYARAVYLHAIIRAIFWSDVQYISRIPRESAERIGKLVRSVKWGWGMWHCNEFRKKSEVFEWSFLEEFYSYNCGNLNDRLWWCLLHIDRSKDDNMCDLFFWIKELGCLFRDF